MEANPLEEIERLKKKIKKLECIAGLRRKQKRGLLKQIAEMRRGLIVSWKALNGEK